MADRILQLKALNSRIKPLENLKPGKRLSILKKIKHKKNLSVKFEDQVPVALIKNLSNDIDKIGTSIESCFSSGANQHHSGNFKRLVEDKKTPLGSNQLTNSKSVAQIQGKLSLNVLKQSQKLSHMNEKVKVSNTPIIDLNIKYKNLANPNEFDRNEFKVVKKKIAPCQSEKVFKDNADLFKGKGQNSFYPSPKIVKQSNILKNISRKFH